MPELKALITTWNEEDNLADCLDSLDFADEIWVVDSFSSDHTEEVARSRSVNFIQREYKSPSDQKNWALDQMGDAWILILDADERVSPELREEIQSILEAPSHEAYWIPRENWFFDRPLSYAGLGTDGVIRLIRGKAGRYGSARVHEKMVCKEKPGRISAPLLHFSYRDLPDFMERMTRYALSGGRQRFEEKKRSSFLTVLFRPLARFLKMYILQRGFLGGRYGFLFSFLSACYVANKHAIHWAYERNIGRIRAEDS
ncbi:MAG: glycosyltransferase family 2 protein [Candidatus Krumholzibacteria bacterium]|jgi:glycosyltransferase involved in cell wall biosynthesis|nr:glycosyltransferase family 2 protein [Candidatus Krumholzibacteria bacterium]MDP6669923.1 glycosyltransferase family 2 protein [Candidatus Krumholzibacteria bacterium]MDP6797347.1 glycosyltransferase family 2 protein [Candidatus Krumholzibacteria bacterium]MDP7020835.1 glycosyltransferase family 2 protein [Candidatus Krumholzibacteria bacterium]